MIDKIVHAVKAAISLAKPHRPPVEYFDQEPMRIVHSSLEGQSRATDRWLDQSGRMLPDSLAIEPTPKIVSAQLGANPIEYCVRSSSSPDLVFGFPIAVATIVSGPYFAGQVRASDSDPESPEDIVADATARCAQAIALLPAPGEPREDIGPWLAHTQARVIELVAGREGEKLAGYDSDPKTVETDSGLDASAMTLEKLRGKLKPKLVPYAVEVEKETGKPIKFTSEPGHA